MKTIHFSPVALLCLLCACSASEAPGEESSTLVPVQITGVSLPTNATTRNTTSELVSGSIGVFNTINHLAYNEEYTYHSAAWSSTAPITIAGYAVALCAYHPYGAASFAPASTSFDLTAQLYATAQDLSYAPVSADTKADNENPSVTFAMVRGYAQLSLNITRQGGYTAGPCKISQITLKNPSGNLKSVRTLDISNGIYVDKTSQETLLFTNLGTLQSSGIASGATDTSLHLLLPPQTLGGLHLLLTIDGVVRSLAIGSAQLSQWVAGKNYVVSVSVNDTGISMSSVSTKEWEDKTIAVGPTPGTPDFSPYYVTLPGVLRVAKGNLMRDGADGAWSLAPDQGYYTYRADGGDYFCWGFADPTIIGNDTGTSMSDVTAGCVAVLGAGWRVPTNAEIVTLTGVSSVWGAYGSQRGESNGRYFGTAIVPAADSADRDNYVFLPAAGYRMNRGSMNSGGSNGCYWSIEPNGDNSAYNLNFFISYIRTYSNFRSLGHSVRCVASL